ncbi:hypothetical protein G4B88_019500 [Cannabis sativa]|uniref:Uncharacterized protein n=1 Tax=Cannabis sativa TaxID=3483 RepID=A0A7J6HZQ8_CANSA|nr:hypothetical protein G4B88_019500 [Cannabis sativa]
MQINKDDIYCVHITENNFYPILVRHCERYCPIVKAVRSKNPSGSNESKSGSGRPELATLTGLLTTHKNLCPLFSNPTAISLNCSTVNDPRLPKQRKTTLRLGCESSQVSDSDRTFRFPSLVRINGPMQWIGGVRPSWTHKPSNMALMVLGSSDSKALSLRSSNGFGMSEDGIGGSPEESHGRRSRGNEEETGDFKLSRDSERFTTEEVDDESVNGVVFGYGDESLMYEWLAVSDEIEEEILVVKRG